MTDSFELTIKDSDVIRSSAGERHFSVTGHKKGVNTFKREESRTYKEFAEFVQKCWDIVRLENGWNDDDAKKVEDNHELEIKITKTVRGGQAFLKITGRMIAPGGREYGLVAPERHLLTDADYAAILPTVEKTQNDMAARQRKMLRNIAIRNATQKLRGVMSPVGVWFLLSSPIKRGPSSLPTSSKTR